MAYKVMDSFLRSCIRIKFLDRHNATYGRKDLFRHMVAMHGKHRYAEGVSVPRTSTGAARPPVGRWTLGKIRPIPQDAMLDRCSQMIAWSVRRLKIHCRLRKLVDVAIDFHDICWYDKDPNMKFMRYSKHKNGTHLFNTLARVT